MFNNTPPFQSPTAPNELVPHTPIRTTRTEHTVPVVTQTETPGIDLLLSAAHGSESPLQHNQTDDALASQTPISLSPTQYIKLYTKRYLKYIEIN